MAFHLHGKSKQEGAVNHRIQIIAVDMGACGIPSLPAFSSKCDGHLPELRVEFKFFQPDLSGVSRVTSGSVMKSHLLGILASEYAYNSFDISDGGHMISEILMIRRTMYSTSSNLI
jgi:hypothetical protein